MCGDGYSLGDNRRGQRIRQARLVGQRLLERRKTSGRLIGDGQLEIPRRLCGVLHEYNECPLHCGAERLGVLRRGNQQALGDPALIDVLVAVTFKTCAGLASGRRDGWIVDACTGGNREVLRPVAVQRRNDVLVAGPGGIVHGGSAVHFGIVERPTAVCDRHKHLTDNVNVIAHERDHAFFEHGQIGRIHLQLMKLRT